MAERVVRQLSRRGWELVRPHGSAPKGISKAIASPSPMSTRAQSSFLDARRPYHGALQSQATFEPAACRNFTSTSFAASKTVVNPRMDDEGNEMKIEILPRASHRLASIMEKDSNPSLCLRVSVESGGCHGFQYLMSLTNKENIDAEEDTVFESEDGKGARVVMDEASLGLLKGSNIDYTMELIGSQFKVTGIPGATSSCGCGTSFDVKI